MQFSLRNHWTGSQNVNGFIQCLFPCSHLHRTQMLMNDCFPRSGIAIQNSTLFHLGLLLVPQVFPRCMTAGSIRILIVLRQLAPVFPHQEAAHSGDIQTPPALHTVSHWTQREKSWLTMKPAKQFISMKRYSLWMQTNLSPLTLRLPIKSSHCNLWYSLICWNYSKQTQGVVPLGFMEGFTSFSGSCRTEERNHGCFPIWFGNNAVPQADSGMWPPRRSEHMNQLCLYSEVLFQLWERFGKAQVDIFTAAKSAHCQ